MGIMDIAYAPDGVKIAYTALGEGDTALAFIHGGLADRGFWAHQLAALSSRYRILAMDLAGHGESGCGRTAWNMQAFGGDVLAVLQAECPGRTVLVGNSLGGPVAVEAALLQPGFVSAIVAVDTFQTLHLNMDPSMVRERTEQFHTDYAGAVARMVRALFHGDADPDLIRDVEGRMGRTPRETALGMFASFGGYDLEASVRQLSVPIRCINGDLYATDIEGNRAIYADFDAVVLPHTGHYPMLECPEEFNRQLERVLSALGL
jgi:pimeloyl-ACP methyl ester carboxylesterase